MNIHKRKGFSLIELVIGLAITFAIIVSGLYFYPKVKNNNSVNNEIVNMNTILTGITGIYNTSNNYDGLNNKLIIEAKIVPSNMIVNNDIVNSWKGKVIVSSARVSNKISLISLKYTDIPSDQCTLFISNVEKTYAIIKTDTAYFPEQGLPTTFIKNNYKEFNFSIDNVSRACNQKLNNITFYAVGYP